VLSEVNSTGKLAPDDRLAIDTPLGQLRSRIPGFGAGTVSLGIFTFAFLSEIKADSADIAFLDNGILSYRDLRYGVFEISPSRYRPGLRWRTMR
jgi:hypothetical protein